MPHDDMRYELIEGELIRMSPAMPEHGWHGAELVLSIGGYAKPRRLGVVFNVDHAKNGGVAADA